MRGRPLLYTNYRSEISMLPTTSQRVMALLFLVVLVLIPFQVIPGLKWLGDDTWLFVLDSTMIFAIGALGYNMLTGMAGQVSLGHSFFMGIGAYVAVILGGPEGRSLWGLGLPMWIWLPAAGIAATVVGVLVAPTAVRLRGLYLAIVTLGLIFIGQHIFRAVPFITGGAQLGRDWPRLQWRVWKEEEPLVDFSRDGTWFGLELSREAKTFFLLLGLTLVAVLVAKNIARSRAGRALEAIRDRDVAAEVMGVQGVPYKLLAFALSSFFAGACGALLASFVGRLIPESWDLFMAVQFVAIILIGGAGTVSGTLLGSFFVVAVPRIVENVTEFLSNQVAEGGWFRLPADLLITGGSGDFGIVSTAAQGPGLSPFQMNLVLYGLLIIGFLIFEPHGLFGIWIRIRNYWKGWPFSY